MRELLRRPQDLRDVLRRRMLRAATSAAMKLDRAARGLARFSSDHQLRACIALARLAPALVGDLGEQELRPLDPERLTPERIVCLEALCDDSDRETLARIWLECFDCHGPQPGRFETRAQAMEYGRQRWDVRTIAEKTHWHDRRFDQFVSAQELAQIAQDLKERCHA